jgi:hypothetical protein
MTDTRTYMLVSKLVRPCYLSSLLNNARLYIQSMLPSSQVICLLSAGVPHPLDPQFPLLLQEADPPLYGQYRPIIVPSLSFRTQSTAHKLPNSAMMLLLHLFILLGRSRSGELGINPEADGSIFKFCQGIAAVCMKCNYTTKRVPPRSTNIRLNLLITEPQRPIKFLAFYQNLFNAGGSRYSDRLRAGRPRSKGQALYPLHIVQTGCETHPAS